MNAIRVHFSYGPQVGEFQFESYASILKSKAKMRCKSLVEQATAHGIQPEEVGVLDSNRFLVFAWQVVGRPEGAPAGWRREWRLVLDYYSVHQSEAVQLALPALAAANIFLFYLPAYRPELS